MTPVGNAQLDMALPGNTRRLSVLLVEDSLPDAQLIEARLEEGGFAVDLKRVTSHSEFNQALVDCRYDVILSDYRVPGFDGTVAMGAARLACPDTPFLFVSGALGEEKAIELLKRGATDYVLKDRLERLVPSVERALQEAAERTERKRAEEQLQRSEERLRTLVSALAEGVMLQDPNGLIQHANASAERILGFSLPLVVGTRPTGEGWTLVSEDGTPCSVEELPPHVALRTGEPQLGKVIGLSRNEAPMLWLAVNSQPLFDAPGGELAGVVTSFSDITEQRKRSEFEQQLVGIVSHDLRNPISAMMMSASALMKRGDVDARAMKALARIVTSGERATALIRDLLDFTQARIGKGIPIAPEKCDLHLVVEAVVEEVRSAHPDRDLVFEPTGCAEGVWDPGRMAQICSNLLSNAVTYSPVDSPVRVRTTGLADCVQLEIWNGGEPIPANVLPAIFEPFRRGKQAGVSSGSIGLGLFIVNQLVRSHEGTVEVRSTAESGTVFRVKLPR